METDLVERECRNCIYYPCLRIDCGNKCDSHQFEYETMIKEIDKKVN